MIGSTGDPMAQWIHGCRKYLCSYITTRGFKGIDITIAEWCSLYDASRAHFHSQVRCVAYNVVPADDKECLSQVDRLKRAMYGTRVAGACFDAFPVSCMVEMGFRVGSTNPCHRGQGCKLLQTWG
eukprot:5214018-Amphidinium_carterae.2